MPIVVNGTTPGSSSNRTIVNQGNGKSRNSEEETANNPSSNEDRHDSISRYTKPGVGAKNHATAQQRTAAEPEFDEEDIVQEEDFSVEPVVDLPKTNTRQRVDFERGGAAVAPFMDKVTTKEDLQRKNGNGAAAENGGGPGGTASSSTQQQAGPSPSKADATTVTMRPVGSEEPEPSSIRRLGCRGLRKRWLCFWLCIWVIVVTFFMLVLIPT